MCTIEKFRNSKIRKKIYLDAIDENMFETIIKGPHIPRRAESPTYTILVDIPKSDLIEDDKKKAVVDKKTKNILFQALDEDLFEHVVHCKSAKEVWDSFVVNKKGTSDVRKNELLFWCNSISYLLTNLVRP